VLCAILVGGLSLAKKATHAALARPTVSRGRRAGSPRGADGTARDLCGQNGVEGTHDADIVLTGLKDDEDGARLLWVRGAHEVCHEVRRRRCARIQRKRYCAGGEATYLDPASLAAETQLEHSSVDDIDDVCERERGALANRGGRGWLRSEMCLTRDLT
jgi:hypothetical protein